MVLRLVGRQPRGLQKTGQRFIGTTGIQMDHAEGGVAWGLLGTACGVVLGLARRLQQATRVAQLGNPVQVGRRPRRR